MAQISYRKDIDGLRAVAVLLVVIYHYFPHHLPGGFVGVDVFFVISGYLITKIIMKNVSLGTFTLRNFYHRRILRIFPALLVVLFMVVIVGWGLLFSDEFKNLGKHVFSSTAFAANFSFWKESGYFDTSSDLKPLLHLWSLGVEEQFYLLWPLLIVLLIRLKKSGWVKGVAVIIFFASLIASLILSRPHPVFSFYLPLTRAWELMLGAGISLFDLDKNVMRGRSKVLHTILSVMGVGMVVFSSLFLDEKTFSYPYYWAIIPTLGAFLVLITPKGWVNRWILSHGGLVYIGLISYTLYLWHWPLLSLAKIGFGTIDLTLLNKLILIMASLILAALTYHLIERKIRYGAHQTRKKYILLGGLAGGMICGALIYLGGVKTPNKDIFHDQTKGYETQALAHKTYENYIIHYLDSASPHETLFYGDSNALHYYPRLKKIFSETPRLNRAVFLTGGGCVPVEGVYRDAHPNCTQLKQVFKKYLQENKSIDTIVFSAAWSQHLSPLLKYKYDEGGAAQGTLIDFYPHVLNRFEKMIQSFVQKGLRVYFVLNIPVGDSLSPILLQKRSFFGLPIPKDNPGETSRGLSLSDWEAKSAAFNGALKDMAERAGATVINPSDFLCSHGVCGIEKGGEPLYRDSSELYGHLSINSAEKYGSYIDRTVHRIS